MRFIMKTSRRPERNRLHPVLENIEGRCLLSAAPAAVLHAAASGFVQPLAVHAQSAVDTAIVNYAKSQLGKKVGDGSCFALAYNAAAAAGAKSCTTLGPTGANANYVWGKLVATLTPTSHSLSALVPGDILQYSNVKLVYPNGAWMEATHHTAIVESVSGNTITVLQQNVNGQEWVQQGTLDMTAFKQGTIWAYQPIPA